MKLISPLARTESPKTRRRSGMWSIWASTPIWSPTSSVRSSVTLMSSSTRRTCRKLVSKSSIRFTSRMVLPASLVLETKSRR